MEGLTEQLFIEKLLSEILGKKNLSIVKKKMRGGSKVSINITEIGSPQINENADYYFLIIDCGGETTVASYIKDQRVSLLEKGYNGIFGLLDVRPNWQRNDIEKLKKFLYYGLPQKNIETKFLLSIMEIEAWFLAEENHYKKINSRLTSDFLLQNYSFNPKTENTENTENFDEPATLLSEIYLSAGIKYNKNKKSISKTVNSLDYSNLYLEVKNRIPSLNELIESIENKI